MESVQRKFDKDMLRSETPVSAYLPESQSQASHSHFPISSTTFLNRKSLCICTRGVCVCACVVYVCRGLCVCVLGCRMTCGHSRTAVLGSFSSAASKGH